VFCASGQDERSQWHQTWISLFSYAPPEHPAIADDNGRRQNISQLTTPEAWRDLSLKAF
jgi:hypothetical protein